MLPSFMLLPLLLTLTTAAPTLAPVIGIYTQDYSSSPSHTYIASSYVKLLESAGALIVPIFYKTPQPALRLQLSQLNGVLFPGGGMDFNMSDTYTINADYILKFAKEQNDLGKVFPVWGICLGHQLLSYLTSGYDDAVIQRVHGEEALVNTIEFITRDAALLTNFTNTNYDSVSHFPGILYYNHHWAVYLSYFSSSPLLPSFWNLVATTTSSSNETFVALMEAKHYPFYGCQFHPEKNAFEWKLDAARGTLEAIEVPQRLAQAFVEKAKLSPNRYEGEEELYRGLIYNYPVEGYEGESFMGVYVFEERWREGEGE